MKANIELPKQSVGAKYRWRIMRGDHKNAEPVTEWSKHQNNLVLPAGFVTGNWWQQMNTCRVGSGTTPNKVELDGTFTQTGTTVTRASGSGVFASANVNDFIKFGTGEIAKITSFTGTTEVEVDRSQEVAATGLTLYDASRTALDNLLKSTSTKVTSQGNLVSSWDTDTGVTQYVATYNFAVETSAQTYTEAALAGAFAGTAITSRVVLESEINVDEDQFLQFEVTLLLTLGKYRTSEPVSLSISGWPWPYNIQSIVSNGTYWDVTLDVDCDDHYATGRPIIITGALPTQHAITAISSNVSEFTVTVPGHGLSISDSVVIDGATPGGYDGAWTVAGVSGDDVTITSGINLGAGSGGTIRLATPGTWYDGTHTIASFPSANVIRITDATSIISAGEAGTVTNSIAASAIMTGNSGAFYQQSNTATMSTTVGYLLDLIAGSGPNAADFAEAGMLTGMAYGSFLNAAADLDGSAGGVYDAGTRTTTYTVTFASANGNTQSFRQFYINRGSAQSAFLVTFDERQRKEEGYLLTFVLTASWDPDLSE